MVYGLLTIIARFINYLLVPIHTKYLSIGDYGVIADVYSVIAILMVLFTYGLETTFFNFTRKEEDIKPVFSTTVSTLHVSSILLGGLLLLGHQYVANYLNIPSHFILFMAVVLVFDALSAIPLAYYRKQDQIWRFSLIRTSGILLSVFINIYLIVICPWLLGKGFNGWYANFYNPAHLIEYIFIANCVSSIWVYLWVLPTILQFKISINPVLIKKLLGYAWPLIFVGMAGVINETIDRRMLRSMLIDGDYQTGVYSAFYKMSIVITLMIQAFRMGAEPFFFAQLNEKNKEVVYAKVLKYFVYACVAVFLLTSLFAEPIARLLIQKEGYFNHPFGLQIVPILLLANVFLGMYYNLSIWYKAESKTSKGAIIAGFGALITLTINYFFIPVYGIMASATATLLCYSAMTMISYHWGQKYFKVPYPMWRISGVIGLGVILVAVFLGIKEYTSFSYPNILAVFCFLFFLMVFWLLERKELGSFIKGKA